MMLTNYDYLPILSELKSDNEVADKSFYLTLQSEQHVWGKSTIISCLQSCSRHQF